ncbi:hypothetical protein BXY47_2967 [Dietzia kunjamensis]|uniref:hypothetical protein n=1 Tax=Dietzia kunjamensis TaxID=322509 RepID=UPI000E70A902|nr:hypothetical protein [Dietzia kunjamensis]MVZ90676.1 hypothetical protein [Microbacter sp. ANSKLAB05]RKE58610.1 hypothetical protein BXY47_2967 [Dietzia kunjamensis]
MAAKKNLTHDNPGWPDASFGEHPVTELAALVAGGLSPFGQETFPLPQHRLGYLHPETVVNKTVRTR